MRSPSTGSASTASSSRSPALDRDALAERRRRHFRHVPGRRVRSARGALAFVEDVGICSTFYVFAEGLACLWEAVVGRANPRWPRRSHHDAGVGLAWTLKDRLPSGRHVYYGKLLKGRPVLVALDVLPTFYALVRGRQRARCYIAEYEAGRLSLTARRLMDSLMRESPQYTRSLRAEAFMLEPGKTREFERAMAELQRGLFIVKTEERYEPSFSYRWARSIGSSAATFAGLFSRRLRCSPGSSRCPGRRSIRPSRGWCAGEPCPPPWRSPGGRASGW
jgi:hypothetical protein